MCINHISRNVRTFMVLILSLNLSHCWRSFNIEFSDPIYTNLAPELFEMNCTIDRRGRISFYLNLKRDLTNAFVHVLVVFDGDGIVKENFVYGNRTIDLCSFLTNRKGSVVLTYLMNIGERFGELAKRCPLKKFSMKLVRHSREIIKRNLNSDMVTDRDFTDFDGSSSRTKLELHEIVLRSEYESGTRQFTVVCATREWNIDIYNNDEIARRQRVKNLYENKNSQIRK